MTPDQQPLAREIARLAELDVVALGMPAAMTRRGEHLDTAWPKGTQQFNDLPRWLAGGGSADEAQLLLIFTAAGAEQRAIGGDVVPLDEPELLSITTERKLRTISLVPMPTDPNAVRHLDRTGMAELVTFVPSFMHSSVGATLIDMLETFEDTRLLSVHQRCGAAQGGLGARLFDAMHSVQRLLGAPETIDAMLAGTRGRRSHSLATLTGSLSANLRFAHGACATLSLSDAGGSWFRGLLATGSGGTIRAFDGGIVRTDVEGKIIDESKPEASELTTSLDAAVHAIASELRRILDPAGRRTPPIERRQVLAMCEAAMLSARTGQPESPATILKMSLSA